jgi:hypothetical protein
MKGFVLKINGKHIAGAIDEGITGVLLTCKNDVCHVDFGSMDKTGMIAYTWYSADLKMDDCLTVCFEDIGATSEPQNIRDYNNLSMEESLIWYRQLKQELIEEGLISET